MTGVRDERAGLPVRAPEPGAGSRLWCVVLNWLDWPSTTRCVASVPAGGAVAGVVVVDNGEHARPGRREPVVSTRDVGGVACVVVTLAENRGFAGGVNAGLREALRRGADAVVVLNNDLVLGEGALDRMAATWREHGGRAVVGAALHAPAGPAQDGTARPGTLQCLGGGAVGVLGATSPRTDPGRRLDYVSGACVLLGRDLLGTLGGFDERYFMYWEDVALGRAARARGYELLVAPGAWAVHAHAGSRTRAGSLLETYEAWSARTYARQAGGVLRVTVPARQAAASAWHRARGRAGTARAKRRGEAWARRLRAAPRADEALGAALEDDRPVRVVVVYDEVRAVHVERHRGRPDRLVLYRRTNYDLAAAPDDVRVRRAGVLGAVRAVLRERPQVVELNEPASWRAWPALVVHAAALRLLPASRRPRVVAYAIENLDPVPAAARRVRLPLAPVRAALAVCGRFVGRTYDAVAFGTEGSRACYDRAGLLRDEVLREARVFPAVPSACGCPGARQDEPTLVFVGAFEPRKGIRELLAAWPHVAGELPGARLVCLGTGPLREDVLRAAAGRPDVRVVVAPPREVVHAELRAARVLALVSQPSPVWREQVGLPLLEGLAHGCAVVASTETGIAAWLAAHGHDVVPPDAEPRELAAVLVRALVRDRPAGEVTADLPPEDTRLAAERWLHDR